MIFRPVDPLALSSASYVKLSDKSSTRENEPNDESIVDFSTCFRWNPDYLRKTAPIGIKGFLQYVTSWNDKEDTVVTLGNSRL